MRDDGRPHPFQVTMRRFGRKLDVEAMRRELPLSPYLFDLIYLDGDELLDEPQSRRFDALGGLASEELVIPPPDHRRRRRSPDFPPAGDARRSRGG